MAPSVGVHAETIARWRTPPATSRHGITNIFGSILYGPAPQFVPNVFSKSTIIGKRPLHRSAPIVGASALDGLANRCPSASQPVRHTNFTDPLIVAATQLAVHSSPSLGDND